ncbi:hypothetical protein Poly41_42440 [Novipirellula artificiosorum]|uniref:Uncharacterized protein n=1 Tax=Novipirellula artificiosorum TaxID=2528016 RepID=A0A5C6DE74_9BACT|nr:hypothetical protein Poly41_42440 [Novipirellula artificiosorum]
MPETKALGAQLERQASAVGAVFLKNGTQRWLPCRPMVLYPFELESGGVYDWISADHNRETARQWPESRAEKEKNAWNKRIPP